METNQGKPQVVYRETISETIEHEEVFDRELAGQAHYARVRLGISPNTGAPETAFWTIAKTPDLQKSSSVLLGRGSTEAPMVAS